MKIIKTTELPEKAYLLRNSIRQLDYVDSYQITDDRFAGYSVHYLAASLFMSKPSRWMQSLMTVRDTIVKRFGLKTGKNVHYRAYDENTQFSIGEKIGFFPVINRSEKELVMAESDRHLLFWVSVLKTEKNGSTNLSLSTVVQYKNFWGRLYFIPVKPFHGLIVRSKIKELFYSL